VDAREASIQMILHRIGEQAGFSLDLGPIGQRTISVQFTDVELELGLRRLLQLASLSYAMQRAPRARGGATLTKLWVFSEGQEAPPSHYENATRKEEATSYDTQQIQEASSTPPNPFVEFFQQAQQQPAGQQVPQASLTPQETSSTTALNPFVEFFQQAQQQPAGQQVPQASLMSQEASSTAPNPFVEFFQQAQQQPAGQQVPQASLTPQETSSTALNPFVEFFQRVQR
jgi:hypothetical protein